MEVEAQLQWNGAKPEFDGVERDGKMGAVSRRNRNPIFGIVNPAWRHMSWLFALAARPTVCNGYYVGRLQPC